MARMLRLAGSREGVGSLVPEKHMAISWGNLRTLNIFELHGGFQRQEHLYMKDLQLAKSLSCATLTFGTIGVNAKHMEISPDPD